MSNGIDLLPPNATVAERAIASSMARLSTVPVLVGDLWNPDLCPVAQLPWLAWALSVDEWDPSWTQAQKRDAIRVSYFVHRHKGTAGAVKSALQALGFATDLLEWFEEQPPAAAYTFAVEMQLDARGINAALYAQIERIALATKNARSHLSRIRIVGTLPSPFYVGCAVMCAETVVVQPYQITELDTVAAFGIGVGLMVHETVTISPQVH